MLSRLRLLGGLLLVLGGTGRSSAAEPRSTLPPSGQPEAIAQPSVVRRPSSVVTGPQPGQPEAIAQLKGLGGRFLAKGHKASWSPDGGRIVFGDAEGLNVIDLSSGRIHRLAKPGKDPAWGPGDGRAIAYAAGDGNADEIWLVAAAGGIPRKLAAGSFPTWSADGKRLFFFSQAKSKLQSIRVGGADASVSDCLAVSGRCPAPSPDGSQVAYRSGKQLLVIDRNSGKALRTWPVASAADCLLGWSPDGKRLAFGDQGSGQSGGLWLLDIERNQAVRVALGPVTMPAWSPDQSRLAFDLNLPSGPQIWTIETKNMNVEELPPLAMATDRSTVPEAAAELVGPLHRPGEKLTCLDLGRFANRKCAETTGHQQGNHLKELPRGEQTFAGVKFRIGDSVVQLGSTRWSEAPVKVEGIPVRRRIVKLYILHATQFGGAQFQVPDGMTIAQYRVRYEDGSDVLIPVVSGQDVRDWWCNDCGKPVTRGQVVWAGRNEAVQPRNSYLRLYLSVWENPHPERAVAGIDYISRMTAAAPFCVAMTVEEPAVRAAVATGGASSTQGPRRP
ncbi:MAG: hypothetical protein ABSF26_07440 [Thermoguttaceae bacterium]